MVNEGCNGFCCCRWYRQGTVSDDWLVFCGCFTSSSFDLHRQVWEIFEVMCRVIDYTVIPHEMEPEYWAC